jgi:alpha-glucosidase
MTAERLWWQTGVVYEIYVRSFADANGDGIGDLSGIRSKLDYLVWLGVDAVWITPIFPSPLVDGGYDVAHYTNVHPSFGTLDDFDLLLREAHARSIRVILDLVPNHTSDRHPWFRASRSSQDDPKRSWYLWRPGTSDGPPNNWLSEFGGSAWELDGDTGEYYYHAFGSAQPDLNWRNPELRSAIYRAMRFWLDRGVDGFRVDALWHVIKDGAYRDNPPNPDYDRASQSEYRRWLPVFSTDQPEVHEVIAEMRAVLDEYDGRLMVGEIYLPVDRLVRYYGAGRGAHLPYNFQLIGMPWAAAPIRAVIDGYERLLPADAWPNWVLGNHDKSRVASRLGDAQARVAATVLLTLRGTPTLYYGDELMLRDVELPARHQNDIRETNDPGRGLGRDPCRTPMPWDGSRNAGFSSGEPWLPIGEINTRRNVQQQMADPGSMLSTVRTLIQLRRSLPALSHGAYRSLPGQGEVLAYERREGQQRLIVIANLSDVAGRFELPGDFGSAREVLSLLDPMPGRIYQRALTVAANDACILEPYPE